MLVNDVGHERDNAAAEVRRSFGGDYDPLYQAAYLIGGLQVRALHRELVGAGRMTDREFHDAFLRENCHAHRAPARPAARRPPRPRLPRRLAVATAAIRADRPAGWVDR